MSTRCNIKITGPGTPQTLYLYRHHDGYLSETGRHIAELLSRKFCKWDRSTVAVAARFLRCCYEKTTWDPARPIYELTDAAHGDINFFYHVDVDATGALRVGYASGYGCKLEHETTLGELATFVGDVNRDIEETNARIRSFGKGECVEIELLTVKGVA